MVLQRDHIDKEVCQQIEKEDEPRDDLKWVEWPHESRIVDIRAPFHNDFRRGLFRAKDFLSHDTQLPVSILVIFLLLL